MKSRHGGDFLATILGGHILYHFVQFDQSHVPGHVDVAEIRCVSEATLADWDKW
jgi:hypothetical protein